MDVISLFASGLITAGVSLAVCRLMKCTPRRISDNYFFAAFAVGVVLWTLKTSIWAGESKVLQLNHQPLGPLDNMWCFLYDHLFELSIGAGVLTVLLGESARRLLRSCDREEAAK